jgi:acyl carrier protein
MPVNTTPPILEEPTIMSSRIEVEELLVTLWQEQLKVDQVAPDDNFLDLGGHSLAAMKIAARLQESLATEIPVSVVLSDLTFRQLVDAVCALAPADRTEPTAAVVARSGLECERAGRD